MSRNSFTPLPPPPREDTDTPTSPVGSRTRSSVPSADGGSRQISPVARNAVVSPVHTVPPRTAFVLDYQI